MLCKGIASRVSLLLYFSYWVNKVRFFNIAPLRAKKKEKYSAFSASINLQLTTYSAFLFLVPSSTLFSPIYFCLSLTFVSFPSSLLAFFFFSVFFALFSFLPLHRVPCSPPFFSLFPSSFSTFPSSYFAPLFVGLFCSSFLRLRLRLPLGLVSP